ncbi:type 1 glutamine amidotransferase domain-containing protein [Microbulbifer hydrolyticus]|uniref:Intracellular protease/amidase n=1 Tax=Microbulbifer hydrolyticus TaxID=48074 RepID=A0A6P1T8A2_9GAMM|nr:type 1 glutamine amidotransferase domain-containing protein [Microbulbifer hydrolyticus]MBB5210511.1 putative intracellular protease/amidase [Microbulbifer hydrolyticus]QHQ39014.1 type 1 glutamine amidotransferase domain-containing protein [Microbulbifer hydrolyticus]
MPDRPVLFVLTGHDKLGDTGDKTGFHLSEAAHPWRVLREAGLHVDFATPEGGKAPIDPGSKDLDDSVNREFVENEDVNAKLKATSALRELDLSGYDAIYFPGGHGTMWDLPDHADVQAAVREMYEAGKVVAAVCHGPAAFVNVKLSDGSWFVDGKKLSVFTDEEERAVEKDDVVPFLLASKLKERGAIHEKADNFMKSVTVDGRLVTGQNPPSARGVGEAIRDQLKAD